MSQSIYADGNVIGKNNVIAKNEVIAKSHALSNATHHKLNSKILGRDFHLLVKRPANYTESKQSYPTIYLLDGGATFPMLAGYYHYLQLEELVPDAIIVGIAYPGDTFETGNYRSTDYTAPSAERSYWGGAATFQKVLANEIIPFVEQQFRSDQNQRAIFGQSIGGQFILYTALTRPQLFSGHIASNPALHRNLEFFTGKFSDNASTRLYVSSGAADEPRFRQPAKKWFQHAESQEFKKLLLKTESIQDHGHFSIAPESFRRGLAWWLAK